MILIAILVPLIALSLYTEFYSPAKTFFLVVVVLTIFGILTPDEVLSGFANEQIAIIMLLLVIGGVLNRSSILDIMFRKLFQPVKKYNAFLARMMFGVAGVSAFVNNTPIVAILIPHVYRWGKLHNISASKLMIPLSYAAILGGTATLVGTSTNLLVNGLALENGMEGFGIFDFSLVGVPLILLGILYMLTIGKRSLVQKQDPLEEFSSSSRNYIVELRVKEDSELIGKTVEDAHLRHLKSLFLVEIIRGNRAIAPVSPYTIIQPEDILLFAGDVKNITELLENSPGLRIPKVSDNFDKGNNELIEVIIAPSSLIANKTVKESDFRSRYDASVVAIHRHGSRLKGKIGNMVLQTGDVLLLIAGKDFEKRTANRPNFYVLSKIKDLNKLDIKRSLIIIAGLLASIALSAFNVISLFSSLMILLGIMTISRIVSFRELKTLIDTNLLLLAAFALALGTAIYKTGAADLLADHMITLLSPFGVVGILFAVYIITNLLTEIMTNIAAASLSFPLALSLALASGHDPKPFILVVAIAASASFITPIGYQTNLMVFGPGGYNFKDFFRAGLPLSLIYMVTTIIIITFTYNLI
ncbi:MAG: SLC13 family permease [Bacteroidetes bacterium]|nr:SLC13 family permease [Bacteroidota bacterium]